MLLSNQARQIRWREGLRACHVGVRVGGHGVERVCVKWKGFLKVGFKVALIARKWRGVISRRYDGLPDDVGRRKTGGGKLF